MFGSVSHRHIFVLSKLWESSVFTFMIWCEPTVYVISVVYFVKLHCITDKFSFPVFMTDTLGRRQVLALGVTISPGLLLPHQTSMSCMLSLHEFFFGCIHALQNFYSPFCFLLLLLLLFPVTFLQELKIFSTDAQNWLFFYSISLFITVIVFQFHR